MVWYGMVYDDHTHAYLQSTHPDIDISSVSRGVKFVPDRAEEEELAAAKEEWKYKVAKYVCESYINGERS